MTDPREEIWSVIAPIAQRYGFSTERRTNAYLVSDEVSRVFNLQRSAWGEQYYLNCGIWMNGVTRDQKPKENRCHLRWRVKSLLAADEAQALELALDMAKPQDLGLRSRAIAQAADSFGLSLLAECSSEETTRALVGRFPHGAIAVHRIVLEGIVQ